jgi:hypothetical protein
MKNYAQDILQFSGYPLEPIVAMEVKKIYESKLKVVARNPSLSPYTKALGISDVAYNNLAWDENWFGNYE